MNMMLNKRLAAGRFVADKLFAAERSVDITYRDLAELNAAIPTARLDANLSAMIGQDVFESSAEAMMLAARMRRLVVEAHARLKAASNEIGLREVSWGDEYKQPPLSAEADQPKRLDGPPPLRRAA
ncbi:hypothetical protein HZF05_11040 [Sphingomonas sp. CGMCC 1.13654]|uniref:Uncharacterized protein n=2 Tax=Sphingomonas chungangi TaxID=2683589 RepID=A0A838L6R8_9SPHN|nr:hypothetical protein [Sphingomonas chungangi]